MAMADTRVSPAALSARKHYSYSPHSVDEATPRPALSFAPCVRGVAECVRVIATCVPLFAAYVPLFAAYVPIIIANIADMRATNIAFTPRVYADRGA